MAPCRDRNPTPIRFEERRIQGLFGLKTTLLLVLKESRAGARFCGRAGRFQTLKQRRLFYAGTDFKLSVCIAVNSSTWTKEIVVFSREYYSF